MVKILITRHGQTKQNVEGTIQGKKHGEINQLGFKQISKLVQRLKKEKIDLIISSDIPRCRSTTEKIIEEIKIPVEYTSLIREKDNGEWVGKNHKEISWDNLDGDFETRKAPNGENLQEVRERGRKFFKQIIKKYSNTEKIILVVSHGAFLKVLIGDLLGMNLHDSIFKLFIEHCSLTEIDINGKYKEGYQVKVINEKDYLS